MRVFHIHAHIYMRELPISYAVFNAYIKLAGCNSVSYALLAYFTTGSSSIIFGNACMKCCNDVPFNFNTWILQVLNLVIKIDAKVSNIY